MSFRLNTPHHHHLTLSYGCWSAFTGLLCWKCLWWEPSCGCDVFPRAESIRSLQISLYLLCGGLHKFSTDASHLWISSSDSQTSICDGSADEAMSVPQLCVWYSVGGIHGSAIKVTDQVRWLAYTAACYTSVTIHLPTFTAASVFTVWVT